MLKELRKYLISEKKDENIFDIVLYGSLMKGKVKPNDIDLMVIFKKGTLKERLSRIQNIKNKIKTTQKIDIKGMLLEELFQESFFGRSGIFLEGISLFNEKHFSSKIDFNNSALFIYNLKDKTHNEKVKFNYILSGRKDQGVIEWLEGKHLAPGVVQIPIKNSLEFEEILKKHKINFYKKNILIQK